MTKANDDVRKEARKAHVPLWMISNAMGISEATMTRKLRCELPAEEKLHILSVIRSLAEKEVKTNE